MKGWSSVYRTELKGEFQKFEKLLLSTGYSQNIVMK